VWSLREGSKGTAKNHCRWKMLYLWCKAEASLNLVISMIANLCVPFSASFFCEKKCGLELICLNLLLFGKMIKA